MTTPARLDCIQHPGHESCACYGACVPDSGDAERSGIYGRGRDACHVGVATEAVDIGAVSRVYGPEGSKEWIVTAGVIATGLVLGGWAVRLWWVGGRRKAGA
ncbi:hypothetical protein ACOALZ_09365 [Nocardiopsis algeriensis]|uniref:hypothetical protein n=1 Tax=Nocardiopsis algeriensis TaxID=1478215 RepID=UPI003B4295B0